MRIVIFSMYYWPEPAGTAPYVSLPAEALAESGHEVEVVAGVPHYPSWSKMQRSPLASHEEHAGVHVHRRQHYVPSEPTTMRRALYEASMTIAAASAGLIPRDADVVVGVVPALASGLAARLAARLWGKPLGLIVHDLMGRGARQAGLSGGDQIAGLVERLEASIARAADRCLVLNESFRDALMIAPDDAKRFVVALPCAMRDLRDTDRAIARQDLGWGANEFVCLHAGNMGQKQGLSNLLAAVHAARDVSGLKLVFLGDGNDRRDLQAAAREARLANVEFIPSVSDGLYDQFLVAADVLLLNQRPELEDMSYPSKLSAYLSAGRPVIGAVSASSPAGRVLVASAGGTVVPPGEPEAVAAAIRTYAADRIVASRHGEAGQKFARQELTASAMLAKYEKFVIELGGASRE